ncbi:patatin-like phospholipase family protein [Legionella lytica]|uniref:Patatin-like phospholipase family protein n=1 Tax=Legionella lytica TaxID=96232 RepID=A0ABY4Y725_9GAMM|nr:patatin-like phospholipase family protein [Legionella lytica]USQ13163.1 patatin-like phospholipase family protein [Legionella lytica]
MSKNKQLKREKVSIICDENGQYVVQSEKHRGLVCSGGGAKGIAYMGMLKALQERGYLEQLTHVSGASAGAMTASLIAVGMSPEDMTKLVNELDIKKLLDVQGVGFRAKGDSFRNFLDVIYMMQIKKHLQDLPKPIPAHLEINYVQLSSKISLYEQALAEQGIEIKNVDDVIKLAQSVKSIQKMNVAMVSVPQQIIGQNSEELENPRITLGDLGVLRELLPDAEKHHIKNLSVAVTNQTKQELERYSEGTTPQQSIAQVVQWSGAHPVLFVPGKNAKGEFVADGGILDNMPEIEGLNREEVLCVKAEAAGAYEARVQKAERHLPEIVSAFKHALDSVITYAIGGQWLKATAALLNREKVFHHIDNMIYINTGDVTTTTTAPTEEQRKQAIKNGYEQTSAQLDKHRKIFSHPLLAVLYVGIDRLDQTMLDELHNPEVFHAAAYAKIITRLQEQIVHEISLGQYNHIQNYAKQIDYLLIDHDHLIGINEEQKEQVLALCYKQVNHLTDGKFLEHMAKVAAKELAAAQPGWGVRILSFLLKPIEWVLSLFKSSSLASDEKTTPEASNSVARYKQVLAEEDPAHYTEEDPDNYNDDSVIRASL